MTDFSFLLSQDRDVSLQEKKALSEFVSAPTLAKAGKLARMLAERKETGTLLVFWQQAAAAFPQWAAARVCYAESLLQHGLLDVAWTVLIHTPIPLQENPKALHLLDQIAWILGYETLQASIRGVARKVGWTEREAAGLQLWQTSEGEALGELLGEALSQAKMNREFQVFCKG